MIGTRRMAAGQVKDLVKTRVQGYQRSSLDFTCNHQPEQHACLSFTTVILRRSINLRRNEIVVVVVAMAWLKTLQQHFPARNDEAHRGPKGLTG